MNAPIRRRIATGTPTLPAAAPIVAAGSAPVRRRVIPIATAAEPKKDNGKAYIRPVDAEEARASADTRMYAAVVKRYEERVRNPTTAIRARCIQCCHGQMKEVQLCPSKTCALHPFRMGINPYNKRTAARLAGETGDDGDESEDGNDGNA